MCYKIGFVVMILMAIMVSQVAQAGQQAQVVPDTVEMIGAITAIKADGTVVINGQTVAVTTAEINVPLTVGTVVKVEGTLLNDGRIAAREVRAPRDDEQQADELEVIGIVESFDGTTLVIAGGLIVNTAGAELNIAVAPGQVVKIHASFDAAGHLVAREIGPNIVNNNVPSPEVTPEVTPDDSNNIPNPASTPEVGPGGNTNRQGEFEITGTLQQVGDGFIVVNGQTISIIGAEIKNPLVVGVLVKVHLSNQNGQLVAREVENARRDADDDDDDDNSGSGGGAWTFTYRVQPGDTLSSIASRAGVSVEELARMNNISDIRVVVAGTQLILPRNIASDDDDDDNSGSGSSNSGRGGSDDDDDDDNSGSGSGNSGRGSNDDDDDDGGESSGSGSSNDDDDSGDDDDD